MTMNQNDLSGWVGHTLVDSNGNKIGKISDIYMDEATGRPEWVAVTTGLFGSNVSFVPLAGSDAHGDDLRVPFTKDQVKDAPNAKPDGQLSQEEESRLYRHYGMDYSEGWSDSGLPAGGTMGTTEGYDRTVGRHESRTTGYDTSGPTTDDAMTRSEEEHEVVLHEERPVVGTEAVPKERVRLDTQTVTDDEVVSGQVRKERIDTEGIEER